MVTLQSAENALKTVYLGVIANQLNTNANPLLNKIKQSSNDVWGKEIKKVAPYGINGGIGAGTESGTLPTAAANNYKQFTATLKNLYGTIEISDKAVRASQNNAGAFVNLLNAEMEGLIKASAFNLGRMLYGDGSGKLATVASVSSGVITVNTVKPLIEGLVVDCFTSDGTEITDLRGARITTVDRENKTITLDKTTASVSFGENCYFTVQGSKGNEITGLGQIFKSTGTLYGIDRATNKWLVPYMKENVGAISDTVLQEAIDTLEEETGSNVDFITCASDVKRQYINYLSAYKRNIDVMELNGGHKAITFNGVPVVSDRFIEDGEAYLLNTKDFTFHQLCDWKWLEGEDGKVIKQKAGYPSYYATLVKYGELICDRPKAQAKLSGITDVVEETSEETEVETTDGEE